MALSQEVVQAQQALDTQRQRFAQTRTQVQRTPTQVRQSQQQLRKATVSSQAKVRQEEIRITSEKSKALKELSAQEAAWESSIAPVKKQIKEAREWETARSFADDKMFPFYQPRSIRQKYTTIFQQYKEAAKRKELLTAARAGILGDYARVDVSGRLQIDETKFSTLGTGGQDLVIRSMSDAQRNKFATNLNKQGLELTKTSRDDPKYSGLYKIDYRKPVTVEAPPVNVPGVTKQVTTSQYQNIFKKDNFVTKTISNVVLMPSLVINEAFRQYDKAPSGAWTSSLKKYGSSKQRDVLITKAQESLFLKELKETGIQKEVGAIYSGEYQKEFEKSWKDRENVSYQEASAAFAKTDKAKAINQLYNQSVSSRVNALGLTPTGNKIAGLQVAKGFLKIAGTPKEAARAVVLAPYVFKVASAIPAFATNAYLAGSTAGGVFQAFKGKTPAAKAGGVATAVTSAAFLGYSVGSYLQKPVVRYVKIKQPRANLKTYARGYDDPQRGITIFEKQKLSQVATAGRRTVVTTRGRQLVTSFWKQLGVKTSIAKSGIGADVYRGVPYRQMGTYKQLPDIFGRKLGYTTSSGYDKAYRILTRGGYTPAHATTTLRYSAPKVSEQWLQSGFIQIGKGKATGEFTYLTKKPVIVIDKKLGIQTRGGRVRKDFIEFTRKFKTDAKGKIFVTEFETRASMLLPRGSSPAKFLDMGASKGMINARTSASKIGYDPRTITKSPVQIYDKVKYKDLSSASIRKELFTEKNIFRLDEGRTVLINADFSPKGGNLFRAPTRITKTPLSKTFVMENVQGKSKPIRYAQPKKVEIKTEGGQILFSREQPVSRVAEATASKTDILFLDANSARMQTLKVAPIVKVATFTQLKPLTAIRYKSAFAQIGLLKFGGDLALRYADNLKYATDTLTTTDVIIKTTPGGVGALKPPVLATVPGIRVETKTTTPSETTPLVPIIPKKSSLVAGTTKPTKKSAKVIAVQGYNVLVKRKGKFKRIEGVYSRGEAIQLGERKAKRTLAATFKIERVQKSVRAKATQQKTPDLRQFRDYKIVKGKKVKLRDTWIQRRRQRLVSGSEKSEFKAARKLKGGRIRII